MELLLGFPWQLGSKELSCSAGDVGSIPGSGRSPGGWHDNPLQYSCLENPHGWRSMEGSSTWGRKESDATEQLSTHTSIHNTYLQIPHFGPTSSLLIEFVIILLLTFREKKNSTVDMNHMILHKSKHAN